MKRKRTAHNSGYAVLQEKYLKTRNNSLLERMYGIAEEAARNYLKKYCRKKGIRLDNLGEKAHDAALYVIEQHLRKPGFKVMRLSAYIHFGVLKALYKNKDQEMNETSYEAAFGEAHAQKDL
jgi:hypothetical protein